MPKGRKTASSEAKIQPPAGLLKAETELFQHLVSLLDAAGRSPHPGLRDVLVDYVRCRGRIAALHRLSRAKTAKEDPKLFLAATKRLDEEVNLSLRLARALKLDAGNDPFPDLDKLFEAASR